MKFKEFLSQDEDPSRAQHLPNSDFTPQPNSDFDPQQFLQNRQNRAEKNAQKLQELEEILCSDKNLLEQSGDLAEQSAILAKQTEILLSLPEKYRTQLGEFANDQKLAKALVISLQATRGVKRKDGRIYATHPQRVVEMILQIASDLSPALRRRSALIAQLHDVIEEDSLRAFLQHKSQPLPLVDLSQDNLTALAVLDQASASLNQLLPEQQLGSAVLIVMEPVIAKERMKEWQALGKTKFLIIYSYFARVLKKYGEPAALNVEIADRIDDFIDVDYLVQNPRVSEKDKKAKLIRKFGKGLFFIDYISHNEDGSFVEGVSRKLYLAAIELMDLAITKQSYLSHDEVISEMLVFRDFVKEHEVVIDSDLEKMGIYSRD